MSNEETMKTILESLEDIQADYEEAETTSDSLIDDFKEDIQVWFPFIIETECTILRNWMQES